MEHGTNEYMLIWMSNASSDLLSQLAVPYNNIEVKVPELVD